MKVTRRSASAACRGVAVADLEHGAAVAVDAAVDVALYALAAGTPGLCPGPRDPLRMRMTSCYYGRALGPGVISVFSLGKPDPMLLDPGQGRLTGADSGG